MKLESQGNQELKDPRDHTACQAPEDLQDLQATPGRKDQSENQGQTESLEDQETKDHREWPVLRVIPDR